MKKSLMTRVTAMRLAMEKALRPGTSKDTAPPQISRAGVDTKPGWSVSRGGNGEKRK